MKMTLSMETIYRVDSEFQKTIQREIGSMNEILKDENCAIESVPSKGYRLGKDEKLKLINVLF